VNYVNLLSLFAPDVAMSTSVFRTVLLEFIMKQGVNWIGWMVSSDYAFELNSFAAIIFS
jgi:hypothetical protein